MPDDRKPFQFGLSTLFLLTLAVAMVLGWFTRPAFVDVTIVSVTHDANGSTEITFRVGHAVAGTWSASISQQMDSGGVRRG